MSQNTNPSKRQQEAIELAIEFGFCYSDDLYEAAAEITLEANFTGSTLQQAADRLWADGALESIPGTTNYKITKNELR